MVVAIVAVVSATVIAAVQGALVVIAVVAAFDGGIVAAAVIAVKTVNKVENQQNCRHADGNHQQSSDGDKRLFLGLCRGLRLSSFCQGFAAFRAKYAFPEEKN